MAGSIAKRPNGRWRARYRDDSGKEHSRHFDRKVDAQRWLDEVTRRSCQGRTPTRKPGGSPSPHTSASGPLGRSGRPETVLAMSLAARIRAVRNEGDEVTYAARHRDVDQTDERGRLRAGHDQDAVRQRIRSVFRAAVKDRVIGQDPTDGVRLPRRRRADMAMTIPTPEQVGQLMAVADERFQAFIGLCASAGLRLRRGRRGSGSAIIDFAPGKTLCVSRGRSSGSTGAPSRCRAEVRVRAGS